MTRNLLFAIAFLGASIGAVESQADEGVYIEFSPGLSILADSDISGGGLSGKAKFDPGFVIGGAIGLGFDNGFRVEGNVSYREADVDKLTSGAISLPGAGDVSMTAIMANVYYDFDLGTPFTPYLGAGLGVGIADVDSDGAENALIVNDNSAEFAWNIMLGGTLSATDNVDLSLGYRYLGITDPKLDATIVGVGSGTIEAEIEVHEIVLGIRYNF